MMDTCCGGLIVATEPEDPGRSKPTARELILWLLLQAFFWTVAVVVPVFVLGRAVCQWAGWCE